MKKEENILELFFNKPTKHWHFEEILRTAKISRPQASYWLKKFVKEKLIKRVKPISKMPYYIANYENPNYQIWKRLFAIDEMGKTGFLSHLLTLPKAKTVIIFGSLSRWDWHQDSDIDLFAYGSLEGLEKGFYREKLHREIQTFIFKDKEEIKKLSPALLQNIIEGYLVKGTLDFLREEASA